MIALTLIFPEVFVSNSWRLSPEMVSGRDPDRRPAWASNGPSDCKKPGDRGSKSFFLVGLWRHEFNPALIRPAPRTGVFFDRNEGQSHQIKDKRFSMGVIILR